MKNTSKVKTIAQSLTNYSVPEWYRDAKFGIFVHYGIYSYPASEFGYKDFLTENRFISELRKFDTNNKAEEWAELFESVGAKYVVPVAIHHDSFALYDSGIQKTYNSVTQAGVDYIGQLKEEITKKGIKLGVSNHFSGNEWFFNKEKGVGTDMVDPQYSELYGLPGGKTEQHVKKWYTISMELIESYQPDLVYYDFDLEYDAYSKYPGYTKYDMLSNYYNLSQSWGKENGVCNIKHNAFADSSVVMEKERGVLEYINPSVWQTCTSIGQKSWCYTTDDVYRKGETFIGALVDIVSKNGNLLLNVGPKADGTIPDQAKKALTKTGDWLSKYGDAIYATRPWLVYGEGTTTATGDSFQYKSDDIRFTRSKDSKSLYATALIAPTTNTMSIKTLKEGKFDAGQIDHIQLIDGSNRKTLEFEQTETALEVSIPGDELTEPYAVEITFKKGNTIPPIPMPAAGLTRTYNYYTAENVEVASNNTDEGSDEISTLKDNAYSKYYLQLSNILPNTALVRVSPDSEGTIEFKTGNESLAKFEVEAADGTAYRTVAGSIDISSVTGELLDLTVVYTGNIKASWFTMINRGLNKVIQAEDFDEKYGSLSAESCGDVDGGQNI